MFDPDLEIFLMFPANEIDNDAVETVTKIKNQNTLFKTAFLVILIAGIVIAFKVINDRPKKEQN